MNKDNFTPENRMKRDRLISLLRRNEADYLRSMGIKPKTDYRAWGSLLLVILFFITMLSLPVLVEYYPGIIKFIYKIF